MNQRISANPTVCSGRERIKGKPIPAHLIVMMLACEDTIEALLAACPTITRGDILACVS